MTAAAAAADVGIAKDYAGRIRPLIAKACGDCHGTRPRKNDLDLSGFATAQALLARPRLLDDIAERVREGDMPPKKAPQPSAAERDQLLRWISAAMDAEAAARAGDPGPVTLRRLNNVEFDNAIRDLTGVDMRPMRELPPDSVGGEGFANVGDVMPISLGLIERYHQAAREVAARAVLLPGGIRFSPSPDRPEWTDEALKALRAFHARHAGPQGEPPLAAHIAATIRHRARLAGGAAAIAEVAAAEKLNERLHEPAVMEAQLRRLLKDERMRGMAEEFGARWLGVRDFASNHGRSLKDFPEFTPALRDALSEEPVRFVLDLLINDRPVADVVAADAAVVNDVLARHYGIPNVSGPQWRRVEGVAAHGRGGLLGLGAVIARHSAAGRSSPIKRGAWVAHLLGERLPKIPDGVPPLPEGEPVGVSVREITERHSKDPLCAGCHARIDPYGMTLERFDAIGRLRPAGGPKPIDARATLPDGTLVDDVGGLRAYIAGKRRDDVLRTLARKLVGYALGRSVMLTDRGLVDAVAASMSGGGRWSDALLIVVRSDQFRCIRPAPTPPATPATAPANRP